MPALGIVSDRVSSAESDPRSDGPAVAKQGMQNNNTFISMCVDLREKNELCACNFLKNILKISLGIIISAFNIMGKIVAASVRSLSLQRELISSCTRPTSKHTCSAWPSWPASS